MANQSDRLLQKARRLFERANLSAAETVFKQYLTLRPKDDAAHLELGEVLIRQEKFEQASRLYARLLEANPANPLVLTNLGASLLRSGKIDDAKSILEYAIELDPKNAFARINLGGVLQAKGDLAGALTNALECVSLDPTSPIAFNNLGSAFNDLARYPEAKHAFETALILDPNQVDAMINLAAIESRTGNSRNAIDAYERVLTKIPNQEVQRSEAIKFYASFEYLKEGELSKGWDYYESGFSPLIPAGGSRAPRRTFDVPMWGNEPLNDKRILVWREQGIGDEIMFSTCLADLDQIAGKVILECDKRLVEAFRRTYPRFEVRAQAYDPLSLRSPNVDFDFHIPIGSLPQKFRRSISAFRRPFTPLETDPQLDVEFAKRMAQHDGALKIGICWRSGTFSPARNVAYTHLQDWIDLLSLPGTRWFNLQYGDCEEEVLRLKEKAGIELVRWSDVDLKNDLDKVFSIMKNLDYVVTVGTAVGPMAGLVGVPTFMIRIRSWVGLGHDDYPWMPSVKIFTVPVGEPVAKLIGLVQDQLTTITQHQPSPLGP